VKQQNSVILLDVRYLPVLKALLREVVCTRCGRSGDDHANADHILVDPENQPRAGRTFGGKPSVSRYPVGLPNTNAPRRWLS